MCAKFGPDRTTDGDVYTLGRIHTQTHTLLYRYRLHVAGYPALLWFPIMHRFPAICTHFIKKCTDFLGSSWNFPDLKFWPLKNPYPRVGWTLHFFIFWTVHDISKTWIFDPLRFPDQSVYMRAKFGCGPTVVSKKGGTDRQTDTHADRQTKARCSFI